MPRDYMKKLEFSPMLVDHTHSPIASQGADKGEVECTGRATDSKWKQISKTMEVVWLWTGLFKSNSGLRWTDQVLLEQHLEAALTWSTISLWEDAHWLQSILIRQESIRSHWCLLLSPSCLEYLHHILPYSRSKAVGLMVDHWHVWVSNTGKNV